MLHVRILKHPDGNIEAIAADTLSEEADKKLAEHLRDRWELTGDYDEVIDDWSDTSARDEGIQLLEIELHFARLLPDTVVVAAPREAWATMAQTLHVDSQSASFDRALRADIRAALEALVHL